MSDGAGQVGCLYGLQTWEPLPAAPTADHACRRAYELAFANAYMFAGERQNALFGFPGGRSPAGGCRVCLASDFICSQLTLQMPHVQSVWLWLPANLVQLKDCLLLQALAPSSIQWMRFPS